MKHRSPKVLYFSLTKSRVISFWKWVNSEDCQYCRNSVFSKIDVPRGFSHVEELSLFLNQYNDNLQSLHIIIDFASLKETDVDVIRDCIIEFPEVQFLFDKHYAKKLSLSSFLFPENELEGYISSCQDLEKKELLNIWQKIANDVNYSFIELNLNNPDDEFDSSIVFSRIINGFDNTFDASNLRYAIKYRMSLHLKVHQNRNFKKTQDSRFKNLAICIEEEGRQNIFNSYSLYANGYRVLPITTSQELEIVNDQKKFRLPNEGIVIRDYDLQFEDEDPNSVDEIRGYRFCDKSDFEKDSAFSERIGKYLSLYKIGWNILNKEYNPKYNIPNKYWDRLMQSRYPLYFISKGPKHSIIDHPERSCKVSICSKTGELHIPGLTKPVCGIYYPFQGMPEVKEIYDKTRYSVSDSDYEITTSRKEHDHSTPLDIYDMANNMIRRAESYYTDNRYLLAALVSREALEFLNGFHHRLMIKAYYIQAIAENAIAMDVVGSNELYLAKDAQFRVNKITEDVDRFYFGYETKSKWNILNHIFSTCRQFCKEHEHFESEAIFISAIAHLNEGYEFSDVLYEIKTIGKKTKKEIEYFLRTIVKWYKQKKHGKALVIIVIIILLLLYLFLN